MTTHLRPLLAGLVLLAMTSMACAAPPTDMPPGGNPPPMMVSGYEPLPPFLHGVVLTEEQRDKIFEIMHAQVPGLRTREKEVRQAFDGLRKLALADEFDDIKAKALADAASRAQAEIALAHARTDHKIYRLLTAEQRKQIQAPRQRDGEPCGGPIRR